jgi:hypothetical protein
VDAIAKKGMRASMRPMTAFLGADDPDFAAVEEGEVAVSFLRVGSHSGGNLG